MRQKVMAVVMLTTLAALMISIASLIAYDLRAYHTSLIADMRTQSELLGHMSSAALSFDDARLATENLSTLRLRPRMRAAAIYNANGTRFATYVAADEPNQFPERPETDNVRLEGPYLILHKRIIEKGEYIGTVYLRADYDLLSRAYDYLAIAAMVVLMALAVAYMLVRRIDRIVTAPLFAITDVAREVVATRDYSRRAPRTSADEVAELVDAFNTMLTEIQHRTSALEKSYGDLSRESDQRASAQQEVLRLNEQLEQRVQERTVQLEMANTELAQAMEEARNANQAKSAFLSSMSHELRTPLNAILGFSQILASETLPSTLEQKKEFANHILKSGRHLLTLINEILDLAKIESGTVNMSIEPVSLADILTEVRNMVEPLAAQRKIRILFPDGPVSAVLRADRTRLRQVLLNLLSNAIKYNRDMGAVVLDCVAVSTDRLRISVQDTGMGLKQEQIAMLFQPFNRLGQENGAEEGTGIGLVVTKRLVELMDGEIGVTSSVGVGSVFWIELSLTQPLALPIEGNVRVLGPTTPARDVTHTLLYVEDNPANLKLVQEIVRFRSDLRLLTAPDGNLGIEMARAHLPDLVLMDLNLPCVSGTDALKVLQTDPRTAHIPVIALTANAMPKDVERGLANGFHRYLTKPINIDEFNEAVNSTLALVDAERGRNAGQQ
jgi:signal transduction histidine kinase/ActR/RegA family two-component response regulator